MMSEAGNRPPGGILPTEQFNEYLYLLLWKIIFIGMQISSNGNCTVAQIAALYR
jgi:hypothetical protein